MYPITNEDGVTQARLLALGEELAAYGGETIALDVLRKHGSVDDFMRRIAANVRDEPLHRAADRLLGIESASRDFHGYSIGRAIRAAMERDWSKAGLEKDVSNLVTTRTGLVSNGFWVSLGMLARDFNVSGTNEAGNLIGSAVDAGSRGDPLRNVSGLARLGVTYLTGLATTLSLPRFTSSSTPTFKSEVAAAGTYLTETASLELAPKRLPVTMVLSRQALIQGGPALDATISRHLIAAVMEELENQAINGDGTSDNPVGLRSTSGIGSVVGGTDGAQLTFAHLADLEDAPADANAKETEFSGFLVNAKTRRWLRTQPRGSGLPYCWDGGERALLGHRTAVSNIMPSDLAKGTSGAVCSTLAYSSDWSQFIVGIYGGGVDVTVDRVTMAADGKVRVTAVLLAAPGANVPGYFATMDDAKTA